LEISTLRRAVSGPRLTAADVGCSVREGELLK
jgi:hypothetical protein